MHLLSELITAAVVMGILDFVWLGFVAKQLYYGAMGDILLQKPKMGAALAFYAVYVIGVVLIVVRPAVHAASWQHALAYGALFGFVAYATYDLTNLATLKGFKSKVAAIDLTWGTAITTIVSIAAYAVGHHI
ncbi:MAG TPA: DUF2177 family protein [Candidatus Saccharimonadales bacterium]|nr:DUF2177 family protein [Candidatus Saccharimonadales bacterium]